LKKKPGTYIEGTEQQVSNPWREAIEEEAQKKEKETKKSFQSLEGGY